MKHELTITTHNELAVIERILQVIRYRGFELAGLTMKPDIEKAHLLISLSVISDKPVHLLTAQLNKLYDVQRLELATAEVASLRA